MNFTLDYSTPLLFHGRVVSVDSTSVDFAYDVGLRPDTRPRPRTLAVSVTAADSMAWSCCRMYIGHGRSAAGTSLQRRSPTSAAGLNVSPGEFRFHVKEDYLL
jgi:hypothetical protein